MMTARANAQTFFGSLVGAVTDNTGAVIEGAKVTLTNTGTAEHWAAISDGNGNYQFLSLVPGMYRVEIEKAGFKRLTRDRVQIQVQAMLRVNGVLQVGEVTEEVVVTSQAPLLQTDSGSLSQVVQGRTVLEMPLNGRNVMNLISLVPGVIAQGGSSGDPAMNMGNGVNPTGWGNYQIGGGMGNQSATYLDGTPLNVSYVNTVALIPTQDAVQEFSVVSNSVSPEFGRFIGGVVNLTTKSGTNQFHGSVYEYFRNKVLNANSFFNGGNGVPKNALNQNQYGVYAEGPVIRDKSFFMFSWEDFKLRIGLPTTVTVPTAAMRAGDFSATGIPAIYDPLTVCGKYGNQACSTDSSGNPIYTRQQFLGNIIPASRLDSVAVALNKTLGLPNKTGILNNFIRNVPTGANQYQINVRGDEVLGDKQRLFARYTRWVGTQLPADVFPGIKTWTTSTYTTQNAVIGDTYTFYQRLVLDVRLSYLRYYYGHLPETLGMDYSQFGPGWTSLVNQMTYSWMPSTQVTGMQGTNQGLNVNTNNNLALSENLTYVRGKHTLKFGAESRRLEWSYAQPSDAGSFNFTTAFTAKNPQAPTGSGYAEASFLLGSPATGSIQTAIVPMQQMWYHGIYLSDVFQAMPKLTLNLGVRWEYPGAFREKHDAATVLLPQANNLLGQTVGLSLAGLIALVNSSDYPSRNIHPAVWDLVAPRLGIAYRINDATVIRSGYGISYLASDVVFDNAPWASPADTATTTMASTLDGGITPYATLSNPFPSGLVRPSGHSNTFATGLIGSSLQSPVPNQPVPYSQQWNLTIERQFPGNTELAVSYAGSKGTHLPLDTFPQGSPYWELNQLPDQYLSMGNALLAAVANPFYGKVPSTAGILTKSTVTQGQLLRSFPEYLGVNNVSNMHGDSNYHSMQLKMEKRFKGNGVLLGTYTWSKLISNTDSETGWLEGNGGGTPSTGAVQDYNNPKGERSVSSQDTPHRVAISYVMDAPFGKGKKYLRGVQGPVGKLISGWGVSGTTTFQSGYPMLFTAQPTTLSSSFGGGVPRPNIVSGCSIALPGSQYSRLKKFFNTACFTQPGPFAYGNAPRTDAHIRYPGIDNSDFAIFKSTSIHENWSLRFEAESFNLANRTQFSPPNSQLGNTSFGIVTKQANQPRLLQFALRLTF